MDEHTREPGTLGKILDLLSPRERRTGTPVVGMMMFLALVETARGIGLFVEWLQREDSSQSLEDSGNLCAGNSVGK